MDREGGAGSIMAGLPLVTKCKRGPDFKWRCPFAFMVIRNWMYLWLKEIHITAATRRALRVSENKKRNFFRRFGIDK